MDIINIFVLLVGLFGFSRTIIRWRESRISMGEFLFWGALWSGAIVFAFFPGVIAFLSNRAGFVRGMDLVVTASVVLMFYLVFRLYVRLDEIEQEITKLVRTISLSNKKK